LNITFKPVEVEDLAMLKSWLEEPHWREWWGDPASELADFCDMIEGKDTTRPFIFHVGGEAAGYIQYWHVGHHQNASWISQNPWLADLPKTAIGVDISIAKAENLSKGFGSAALVKFVETLKRLGYGPIIIDPDPRNKRAVRAYEKAGFKTIEDYNLNAKDCLIMVHEA